MGRPLKIKKIIETSGNGVDIGFNALTSLDVPVPPSPIWSGTEYLGVVGGVQPPGLATAAYPIVKCEVNIANSFSGQTAGQVIRQKGARKFLVATNVAIDPANAVVGVSLRIATVGNTNWLAMGAPVGYGVGTTFAPTAPATAGTTGTAQEVGQCVLVNDLAPTAGNMSISYSFSDSTEQTISKLTNKFLQNFNGGEIGGVSNTGECWNPAQVVNNVELAANFFSDEGTTAKSGAETDTWGTGGSDQLPGGVLDLGIVENYQA